MTILSDATLAEFAPEVSVPRYDRSRVTPGIVHFGVGNFHRAHEAVYLDDLMNDGEAMEWGICGVGLLPQDARMRDTLLAQDGLYTLVLRHSDGRLEPRVIGSIVKYLFAPDDSSKVVEQLADPATRIVSLTVTEGGYNNHPVTGKFDVDNPAIRKDSRSAVPSTVFGFVVAGLRRRRAEGTLPFTVMSCDNIQENGNVARAALIAFARLSDSEFADWIEENVAFPNSMVDRITPVTTLDDVALVERTWGVADQWPVLSEPFRQWVLEDCFADGRPPFERAGVQLVPDVMPYELMKLRLLNVSHQALAYFGFLAGYRFTHEAVRDPDIREFVRAYMDRDATPTLLPVPGVDVEGYKEQLLERLSNPEIRDTLARLCADTSNRIPKWLVPIVTANLRAGRDVSLSAAIIASWARYAEGVDERGVTIAVVDPLASTLTARARAYPTNRIAFLQAPDLFGDLARHNSFVEPYLNALALLHTSGAAATLGLLRADGLFQKETQR
jgi:mannitol 2-dehydrogenase